MGTRADFYLGKNEKAVWLGSIAWDGYPEGIRPGVLAAGDEKTYLDELAEFFKERDDLTLPEHGWPWPWEDSFTTDFGYSFFDGKVWAGCRDGWFNPQEEPNEEGEYSKYITPISFPDMSSKQKVTLGSRSGLIVFRS